MKKQKNKLRQKALKALIKEIANQPTQVDDCWSSFKHKDKEYDCQYLYDENRMIYIYEVIGNTRCMDEYDMFEIK